MSPTTIQKEFFQWVLAEALLKYVLKEMPRPKKGDMDWKRYEAKNILERWIIDNYNRLIKDNISDEIVFPLFSGLKKIRGEDKSILYELVSKELADSEQRAQEMLDYMFEMILEHNNSFNPKAEVIFDTVGDDTLYVEGRRGKNLHRLEIKITYRIKYLLKKYDIEDVVKMLLRYKGMLAGGQHWSPMMRCDKDCLEKYPDKLIMRDKGISYIRISPPETELEGFASPVNSQLLPLDRSFCSLFGKGRGGEPDVDAPFGSIGNFFDVDLNNYEVVAVSPPYTEHLMNEVSKKVLHHCAVAEKKGKKFMVSVVIPEWSDLKGYVDMQNSKYLIELIRHDKGNHINFDFWTDLAIPPPRDTMQFLMGHNTRSTE